MAKEFEIVANPQFRNIHAFLVHMQTRTPHIHRELELGYVLHGTALLRVGSSARSLRPMEGYLVNPFEVHEFCSDGETAIILAIQISPRLLESFFAELPTLRFQSSPFLCDCIKSTSSYEALFHQCVHLARLYLEKSPHHEYDCFATAAIILSQLHHLLPLDALPHSSWKPLRRRRERMISILDFIDENFQRKLLLEEIAQREGLTMPYLSALFRETLGISFQEYLKKKRFEHARALIVGTNRTLLDICLESGFSDTRYMIRLFEAEFGCTPRAYRQKNAAPGETKALSSGTAQRFLSPQEALDCLREVVPGKPHPIQPDLGIV